jgi:galactonate dehydratase
VPRAAVEYCAEYLVGKDPLHIERHWQHMFRRQLFRGGSDMMAAIGAIDIALWDIKGKSLGKPVYELLGGPVREKVRLYTHLGGNTLEALAEEAAARVEEGFTALRIYPFGDFGNSDFEEGSGLENMSFTGMQNNAVERLAAVRDAAGPDTDIMIDVVNRLTPAEAIGLGRALEPFNLYFYEDPIEPENMDQWSWVAQQQPIPLAMGERLYTIYQFRDLLNHQGAAFIRPDRRIGLRRRSSAQPAQLCADGRVRPDRRCDEQHTGPGIPVRRRQRHQGRTRKRATQAGWRLPRSPDHAGHWR